MPAHPQDLLGGTIAKTPRPNAGGLGSMLKSGNQIQLASTKILRAQLKDAEHTVKILQMVPKTQCSQIQAFSDKILAHPLLLT